MERMTVPPIPADQLRRSSPPAQHYEVLKELGDCYAALGECEHAGYCYERAASVAPAEPGPYIGLGVIHLQDEQHDRAREAFQIAVELRPEDPEGYVGLAAVYQQTADYPAAFDMYLRCLERDADCLIALLGLFQTSSQMGTFSQIIHYLQVYLQKHPDD
ncbi:MAG: hypothetical protein KAX78_05410, partial [Phycisphaerae bacterium]|nr:hypothetical protein [Phycisphaerae bacterium]